MKTAVQIRRGESVRCAVFEGEACAMAKGAFGPVALFDADHVVGYRVEHRRRVRAFLFRTLVVDDPWAAAVPGVRPRVRLLVEVRTAQQVRRLAGVLRDLGQQGCLPAALSDAFYLRVGQALAGRGASREALRRLLRREPPRQEGWGAARGMAGGMR